MRYRSFGRPGWQISEIGYGMWGIGGSGAGGWTGADDDTGHAALQEAVDLGCNFFDTAWIYGRGHSERMFGRLLRSNPGTRLHVATKIPPKDLNWPSMRLALRFVLHHPAVSTVIPGMRHPGRVRQNLAVSDGTPLPADLLAELRRHRWDRAPTIWSQ